MSLGGVIPEVSPAGLLAELDRLPLPSTTALACFPYVCTCHMFTGSCFLQLF